MRLSLVCCLVLVLVRSSAPHAQATSESRPSPDDRPARALLIQAGIIDTTAVPEAVEVDSASSDVPDMAPAPVAAAPIDPTPLFYVIERNAPLRAAPDERAPLVERLPMREGVRLLADSVAGPDGTSWRQIRHGETEGYVRAAALSNLWIRVNKTERTVYVYQGAELVKTLPADVSAGTGDKVRRSRIGELEHYRIPEGTFFVSGLNGESQYYKAFIINYPNRAHAERGLRDGLITPAQYRAIVAAEENVVSPPMGTRLGGLIEIHGSGSGRRRAWTRGCVALRNVHMDDLWDLVHVGTPVVIEP